MVNDRFVVKMYSNWDGRESHSRERHIFDLHCYNGIDFTPKFVGSGTLAQVYGTGGGDGWDWPFVVSTVMPGTAMRDLRFQMSGEQILLVAEQLGKQVKRLHEMDVGESDIEVFTEACFRSFLRVGWLSFW